MAKHSRKFGARCLSDLIENCVRTFISEGYDAEAYMPLRPIVHWRCPGLAVPLRSCGRRVARCIGARRIFASARVAAFPQRTVV
jgi:hypothetical protein